MSVETGPAGARSYGLGKGLAALLGESAHTGHDAEAGDGLPRTLALDLLEPNPQQPRRYFAEDELDSLAESIREKGIVQPLLVRPSGASGERYQIVAGERRWRAAQRAGLHAVPVVVRRIGDVEALELALVENLQREDLRPLEEADAYQRLMVQFHHRQEDVASALGKSRSHVANMVRLLALPDAVKAMLESGTLSAGHARALLGAPDPARLAETVAKRGLNVRQTERLVRDAAAPRGLRKAREKDANVRALEDDMTRALGLKVTIDARGAGGTLSVAYRTLEQLDALVKRLRAVH